MEDRTKTIEKFKNYEFKNPIHKGWQWFQKKGMYEYAEPSQQQCDSLLLQSQNAWDYKCKVKFLLQKKSSLIFYQSQNFLRPEKKENNY